MIENVRREIESTLERKCVGLTLQDAEPLAKEIIKEYTRKFSDTFTIEKVSIRFDRFTHECFVDADVVFNERDRNDDRRN